MSKPIVAAQLYSLREFTQTPEAVARTLKKVAEIGYTAVQVSAVGPIDNKELATMAGDNGLAIAATHVGWDNFLNDLDALIEKHRVFGCSHPAIGGLAADYQSLDGLKRFIDELGPVAEGLAAAGMDFSYHNHSHELVRYEGRTWLDRLYSDAGPDILKAEIDTYWIQHGGGDPAEWIRRCAGREPLVHLKDMKISEEREQRYAPVGAGNLNWPAILAASETGGAEYLFVEQDDCYEQDPFDAMAESYRNLKAMGYA